MNDEKDTERLNWIETHYPDIWLSNTEGWCVGEDFSSPENQRGVGKTLREAIDDAIRKDFI